MKKSILFAFILISVLAVGCTMNNKNEGSSESIKKATEHTENLIGSNFKDMEKSLGIPFSSVYYVDTNTLKHKNIENLTLDDLRDSITILSTYKNADEDNSYVHVYYENGKVKDALAGEYNLYTSDRFVTSKTSDADYKVEFFKGKGTICKDDFSLDYAKKNLIGKKIGDFNNSYYVKSANFIASPINGSNKLYFYPLVPHNVYPSKEHKHPSYQSNEDAKLDVVNPVNNNISNTNKTDSEDLGEYAKSAILVKTTDGMIKSIEIIDNNFVIGTINKTLNK